MRDCIELYSAFQYLWLILSEDYTYINKYKIIFLFNEPHCILHKKIEDKFMNFHFIKYFLSFLRYLTFLMRNNIIL